MALTGQAKTDYQREYMRRYRARNADSAITGQTEGSENEPEQTRMDKRSNVRPSKTLA